jgi:hypothetical protein
MLALVLLGVPSAEVPAEESRPADEPAAHVFRTPGGVELKAYACSPLLQKGSEHRPGIVVFHGGGWAMTGCPSRIPQPRPMRLRERTSS